MDQFLTTEGLQDLMKLFIICVALFIAVGGFISYCRKVDAEMDDLDDMPPLLPRMYCTVENGVLVQHDRYFEDPEWLQQAIRQGYRLNREPIESAIPVLNNIVSLRTDLRDHRNPTRPGSKV